MGQRTSLSDEEWYRNTCQDAATRDEAFEVFRQNADYRKIVETVNRDEGQIYLDTITKRLELLDLNKCKENDEQGGPILKEYPEPIGHISPTTLRYAKILTDLVTHFGKLDGWVIAEVGGGYGGQCKLIKDHFDIKEYHIYDLPEPIALMQKYLTKYGHTGVTYHNVRESMFPLDTVDLFISNYAFSELARETQDFYIKRFIERAANVYMICNWPSAGDLQPYSMDELRKKFPQAHVETDIPPWTNVLFWGKQLTSSE